MYQKLFVVPTGCSNETHLSFVAGDLVVNASFFLKMD